MVSYAQGFMLMRQAAKEFGWKLNYGSIALMWRGGCIIRRYKKKKNLRKYLEKDDNIFGDHILIIRLHI